MDHRGPMKAGTALRPVTGAAATPHLIYHVDAITRALKNWNDLEALKLLRLHWGEISTAVRELDSRRGAAITVPLGNAPLQPDKRPSRPADLGSAVGTGSEHEDGRPTAEQRRFGSNVRTFSRA